MSIADYNKTRAERGWPLVAEHGTRTEADADGFSREVIFEPGHAWTTRNNAPSSNYGRGSLRIRFLLHGPRGTVQFLWATGVTPERQMEARVGYTHEEWMHSAPMGFDVGYHADEPQYGDDEARDCDYRPSGSCYYDGSSLAADEFLEVFLTEGEDAMWAGLHQRYVSWFEAVQS